MLSGWMAEAEGPGEAGDPGVVGCGIPSLDSALIPRRELGDEGTQGPGRPCLQEGCG